MSRVLVVFFVICLAASFCSAIAHAELFEAQPATPDVSISILEAGLSEHLPPEMIDADMTLPPAGKLPINSIQEDFRLAAEEVQKSV